MAVRLGIIAAFIVLSAVILAVVSRNTAATALIAGVAGLSITYALNVREIIAFYSTILCSTTGVSISAIFIHATVSFVPNDATKRLAQSGRVGSIDQIFSQPPWNDPIEECYQYAPSKCLASYH